MRSWLSALTLGEWGLTKPCNGGNASTSLIEGSTGTKSGAYAKGGSGEGAVVNAWVKKNLEATSLAGKKNAANGSVFSSAPSLVSG
jgi:hypothetical protein